MLLKQKIILCVFLIFRVAIMDKVTDFVLILGKMLVAGCIGK